MDVRSLDTGDRWSDDLRLALGASTCLLALTSPMYLNSVFCGKEFQVFSDRLASYQQWTGTRPPSLLALRWEPTTTVPGEVAAIQYGHGDFGPEYKAHGLRFLVRLRANDESYDLLLGHLAARIVQLAEEFPLERDRTVPEFSEVTAAFPAVLPDREEALPVDVLHTYFVVAAGDRRSMESLRTDLGFYGLSPEAWAPFRPDLRQPIAYHARIVATGKGLATSVAGWDACDLVQLLEWAAARNQIVVLIVDAWSERLPGVRALLHMCDQSSGEAMVVAVPFSATDAETIDQPDLAAALFTVFRRRRGDPKLFLPLIPDHTRFGTELLRALAVAQNRILSGPAVGPIRPNTTLPRLGGPRLR
jgi:FxsC-like protein